MSRSGPARLLARGWAAAADAGGAHRGDAARTRACEGLLATASLHTTPSNEYERRESTLEAHERATRGEGGGGPLRHWHGRGPPAPIDAPRTLTDYKNLIIYLARQRRCVGAWVCGRV